ncbi:transglutaminaseTgpA domain-containing protein [Pseudoalteromonas byunsanensis]|uniref:Transglutaminase-like domain-containing protein n=1 Tax=Pseudoalteromonas byunsanensis TaxID=327939 RepID=A0A1S1N5N7_9GAMM|nr:DUF3488 and transglutaminase-like domain-containing protein [Pseudoalteromonas byunsanensis]OHU96552.1 hypothetical protein BIW53_04280 [Pseudoalteromonas byunsanensis]
MITNHLTITLSYLLITFLPVTPFGTPFNILMLLLAIWHGVMVYKKNTGVKNSLLNIIAILGIAITVISINITNTVELFVALMLLACQLKVLQATTNRQWQQIHVLNFFTIPSVFLFSQSLYVALMVMMLLGINLVAMLQLQHRASLAYSGKFTLSTVLLSMALSILLLIFMPKLPAFWQMPGPTLAKTGLTEDVDPFNIVKLAKSDELAFRAIFSDGSQPQINTPLYWRAIIHDKFDGNQWRMSNLQNVSSNLTANSNQPPYKIIAQASNLPWLYALEHAISPTKAVNNNYFGTLFRTDKITSTFEYQVQPANARQQVHMPNWQYRFYTTLPEQLNPKTQALAKQWDLSSTTTKQFIDLMQLYFVTQAFSYTLTPDVTNSEHKVDQFLFEYKNGFCGHYASSVAILLRSAGIPARLVSGYLGAEYNNQLGYFSVYQYDAHAWVEYYVPNEGWKVLDPTAWVSPDRLLGSLSEHQTLAGEFQQNLGLSLVAWSDFKAVNWLRLQLEQLDYQWTRWVLNFDQQKQASLLQALFGAKGKQWVGALVILIISVVLTLLFFYVKRAQQVKEALAIKRYRQLIGLSKKNLSAAPPKRAVDELIQQFTDHREMLQQFYADFAANRYQGKSFGKNQNKHAKNLINSIKTKAKR